MSRPNDANLNRRRLLHFLAASPVLAPVVSALDAMGVPNEVQFSQYRGNGEDGSITSPEEAINVFDFQEVAESRLSPAHYGYVATGVDGDLTVRANRDAFERFYIRPRRLVDVSNVDMSVELFGTIWETPIILAPVGSQAAFHSDGELGTARAARAKNHLQILSTVTSNSVETVTEARGAPIWFQLYPTSDWSVTKGLLRRAEGAGCPVVVLTVDLPTNTDNRNTLAYASRRDKRDCSVCHVDGFGFGAKPMFEGLEVSGLDGLMALDLTWNFVKQLKDATTMKVVIKGIVTREDARLAVEYGADGIIVSNHGGRAEESGRGTIESLSEVVEVVDGRIPVLIDGGFRRGNDFLKALALGASAVLIGRPYIWGLGAFGQQGVEVVLDILRRELRVSMQLAGTSSVAKIGPAALGRI